VPGVAGVTARVSLLKRQLDQLVDQVEDDGEPGAEERLSFTTTVANFKRGDATMLAEATSSLWAYYRSVASEFTPEQRAAYGIPEISSDSDIWEHVSFRFPPSLSLGGHPLQPAECYLSFEGEVSWEPEHGLQLVFENGERVCKVSQYDGHNTVAHAVGDASLLGVIFG
jgi:hypothetical protein